MKRAAIYIRVSTEAQSEKISPEIQEKDCIEYCQRKGYQVIGAYRDTEKYKVGNRLIEPSGTRNDRPQLKRMLADSDAGLFDVLIAWREDRLYRGVNRAMLEISDRVSQKTIEVELVKEFYDPFTAPVKAWAAGVELQAKHDRHIMGVRGRLAKGKMWAANPVYGYDMVDGFFVVNEIEAGWVRSIWKWYGEGWSVGDIRSQLITSGALQKGVRPRKYIWSTFIIRHILAREDYFTGIYKVIWDGENHELSIPPILEAESYYAVKNRQAQWKIFPAGNYGEYALAGGLLYCHGCNVKMHVVRTINQQGRSYLYYRCDNSGRTHSPDCVGYLPLAKTDNEIWSRLWSKFSKPDELEEALQERIGQLRAEETDAGGYLEGIQTRLDELTMERQWVITQGRKRTITADDMELQLMALTIQENELRREYSEKMVLTGDRAEKLIEMARIFREDFIRGLEEIDREQDTEKMQKLQFEFRRKIISGLVTRVDVFKDKTIQVQTELDFTSLFVNKISSNL
jgi:DNA invertase Pin-like site-specific DNA recombinase